jgi:acetyl esterase
MGSSWLIRCLWGVLLGGCIVWCRGTGAAAPSDAPTPAARTEVRYGPHDRNVLDVWQVPSTAPTPVLIYFHGGGFVGGDKAEAQRIPVVTQCLAEGISVVSANYRFVRQADDDQPAVTYTAPLEDAQRVVQFVRSKADDWNLVADRVAASGASAGAIMAMWVALRGDAADPSSSDPLARYSTKVQAAVPYAGPTTLDPEQILKHVGGPPSIHSSLPPFFGVDSVDDLRRPDMRPAVRDASPIEHVSAGDPPLYLIYLTPVTSEPLPAVTPTAISIHHANFGELLKRQCDAMKVPCLLRYPGSGVTVREVDFLKRVFGAVRN